MSGFSSDYPPCCGHHRQDHTAAGCVKCCCAITYPPLRVLATPDLDDDSDGVLEGGIVRDDELRREERW